MIKFIAVGLLVVQNVTVMLTMHYSQTGEPYLSTTTVVLQELSKLIISILLLIGERKRGDDGIDALPPLPHLIASRLGHVRDMMRIGVPGCLYLVSNNLLFVAAKHLASSEVMLLMQLKILVTAVLSVIILGKLLSRTQWMALFVLFVGAALSEIPGKKPAAEFPIDETRALSTEPSVDVPETSKVIGMVAALLSVSASGFAGIYTEKLLKDTQDSMWIRNIQLSTVGILIGLCVCAVQDGAAILENGFFQGYNNVLVWAVILLNAAGGLLVAVILKYGDNILKCFAVATGLILCYIVQKIIEPLRVDAPYFVPGALLVCVSVTLYGLFPPKPVVIDEKDDLSLGADFASEFGLEEDFSIEQLTPSQIGRRRPSEGTP